jgi:hypothetical protein
MTVIKLCLLCLSVMPLIPGQSRARGWRGIVPLHSTRVEVERLIGKPNFGDGLYDFEKERVFILYSGAPCTESSWNVPRDTVIQISVAPKGKLRLSGLHLDLSKYERIRDPSAQVHTHYENREEGIRYQVFEGGGGGAGTILSAYYGPAAADANLRCPAAGPGRPSEQ